MMTRPIANLPERTMDLLTACAVYLGDARTPAELRTAKRALFHHAARVTFWLLNDPDISEEDDDESH